MGGSGGPKKMFGRVFEGGATKTLEEQALGPQKNSIREMCSSGAVGPILQPYSSISKRIFHKICRFWPKMGQKNVQKF